MAKITVFTQVRNGEKTLARTIDSVLAQDFRILCIVSPTTGARTGRRGC
ncbi:MAG: hypothetical protein LBU36_00850 [Clostridiales bacterium]|nr:hypothetical protein [Clostridiales bacterium]